MNRNDPKFEYYTLRLINAYREVEACRNAPDFEGIDIDSIQSSIIDRMDTIGMTDDEITEAMN